MIDYKEYFLEYLKGDNKLLLNPNPRNSKRAHVDPSVRKHANILPKKYKHKHPLIDNICTGKANNVQLAGQPLLQILSLFNTNFKQGSVVLGNSCVEVEMYEDENGQQIGILRNRKK